MWIQIGVYQDNDWSPSSLPWSEIALGNFNSNKQRDTCNKGNLSERSHYETDSDVNDSDNLSNPSSVALTEGRQSISDGLRFEGLMLDLSIYMNTSTRVPRVRLGLATTSLKNDSVFAHTAQQWLITLTSCRRCVDGPSSISTNFMAQGGQSCAESELSPRPFLCGTTWNSTQ